jgi:hypothetical protein
MGQLCRIEKVKQGATFEYEGKRYVRGKDINAIAEAFVLCEGIRVNGGILLFRGDVEVKVS